MQGIARSSWDSLHAVRARFAHSLAPAPPQGDSFAAGHDPGPDAVYDRVCPAHPAIVHTAEAGADGVTTTGAAAQALRMAANSEGGMSRRDGKRSRQA
jgi:hypothetical protein